MKTFKIVNYNPPTVAGRVKAKFLPAQEREMLNALGKSHTVQMIDELIDKQYANSRVVIIADTPDYTIRTLVGGGKALLFKVTPGGQTRFKESTLSSFGELMAMLLSMRHKSPGKELNFDEVVREYNIPTAANKENFILSQTDTHTIQGFEANGRVTQFIVADQNGKQTYDNWDAFLKSQVGMWG